MWVKAAFWLHHFWYHSRLQLFWEKEKKCSSEEKSVQQEFFEGNRIVKRQKENIIWEKVDKIIEGQKRETATTTCVQKIGQ